MMRWLIGFWNVCGLLKISIITALLFLFFTCFIHIILIFILPFISKQIQKFTVLYDIDVKNSMHGNIKAALKYFLFCVIDRHILYGRQQQ